jgi:hypothetical protein
MQCSNPSVTDMLQCYKYMSQMCNNYRYGVPVLDTYDMTLGMHMAHIARDCLHYCSPGVPELRAT